MKKEFIISNIEVIKIDAEDLIQCSGGGKDQDVKEPPTIDGGEFE